VWLLDYGAPDRLARRLLARATVAGCSTSSTTGWITRCSPICAVCLHGCARAGRGGWLPVPLASGRSAVLGLDGLDAWVGRPLRRPLATAGIAPIYYPGRAVPGEGTADLEAGLESDGWPCRERATDLCGA
jgi:hypothetical protein